LSISWLHSLALRGSGALAEGDSNCGRELNRQLFTFGKKQVRRGVILRGSGAAATPAMAISTKTVIGEEIALPRDCDSTFEPQIVAKPGSRV
jgi:hypothetical protein